MTVNTGAEVYVQPRCGRDFLVTAPGAEEELEQHPVILVRCLEQLLQFILVVGGNNFLGVRWPHLFRPAQAR